MEKELIEVINLALNLYPLWKVERPNINKCTKDELDKFLAIETLNEKLIKVQEKYYKE